MNEKPLLFFPRPVPGTKSARRAAPSTLSLPTAEQQHERLEPRFQQIVDSFLSAQETIDGAEPEMVVVFETVGGEVAELARAAQEVDGLEWLAELQSDEFEARHGFQDTKRPEKLLPCRLYAVMSNHSALERLIRLWNEWHQNPSQRAEKNFGPFRSIFAHLLDVRPWSVEDRIRDTGILEAWEEDLGHETGLIRFEVELWSRGAAEAQNRAFDQLSAMLSSAGGRCISRCALSEISYDGVLAELPAEAVRTIIDRLRTKEYTELLRFQEVMFFRPFGQSRMPTATPDADMPIVTVADAAGPDPSLPPIVALLDGLPLEKHRLLDGRLIIDDPDGHAVQYEPISQRHGTAMASLICWGDLDRAEPPLPRNLYVRPIFVPETLPDGGVDEITPRDRLIVDLIHQAVRRIKEGDGPEPPTASDVKVINLSLGNRHQPFVRNLSPLARLLDWLAWKYGILFIVSAGNQLETIVLETPSSKWRSLSQDELVAQTLTAIRNSQAQRRPLSPAEAINAVAVGATHADNSQARERQHRVDLLPRDGLPSPIGTVSLGFQRALVPVVLMPGGRQLFVAPLMQNTAWAAFEPEGRSVHPPGIRVAAPGHEPMHLDRTIHTRGTSNATALATRHAAQIYERLLSLRNDPGGDRWDDRHAASLLKMLLVHGASWGRAAAVIEEVFRDDILEQVGNDAKRAWQPLGRLQASFLGYGEVSPERALFCTDRRVTLIGWGTLATGDAHQFEVPLPEALSGLRLERRLIVTLGWITPVNFGHRKYRRAFLWFDPPETEFGLYEDREGVDKDIARRGTVQHQIYTGDKAIPVGENAVARIQVNCAEHAGRWDEEVPYAFAVTLELAQPILASIYEQIREKVQARIRLEG
jgi:hypothetical protein